MVRMFKAHGIVLALGAALALAGCSDENPPTSPSTDEGAQTDEGADADAGGTDPGGEDPGPADPGPGDQGPGDEGPGDEGPGDEGPGDEGPGDEGPGDEGPGDEGPGDEGPGDEGPGDEGPGDEGPGDEGPGDEGPGDQGDGGGSDAHPGPGEVIFTEIMKDPSAVADDAGEWFELTSLAAEAVELDGCVLTSDNDADHVIDSGGALVLGPGEIAVVGLSDNSANGGVAVVYVAANLNLGNGGDTVTLTCSGVVVDTVTFDGGATWPDESGASISLDPDAYDADANDDPLSWCLALDPYGDGDLGTPGAPNPECPEPDPCDPNPCLDAPANTCEGDVLTSYPGAGACANVDGAPQCEYTPETIDCATLGTTCVDGACLGVATTPTPGDLVITEIMQNPDAVGDDSGEWFEVTNVTANPLELAGCIIDSLDDSQDIIAEGGTLIIEPGAYLVFGLNGGSDVNGGVTVDWAYLNTGLSNGTDSLTIFCAGAAIDSVTWDDGATFPDPSGASMQLDPASTSAGANDSGAAWCAGMTAYGDGDLGTPGAPNAPCPDPCEGVVCDAPPANTCDGDLAQTYAAAGTCELGLCVYPVETSTDCALTAEVCQAGACVDPGNVAPAPLVGEVIVSEVMQNPSAVADDQGEWFELTNLTDLDLELAGCLIESAKDNNAHTIADGGSLVIPAFGHLVLGINADPATNGGVGVHYQYADINLANSDDSVAIVCGGATIDGIAYDGGPVWPDPAGASMSLNPDLYNAVDNDAGESWCEGSDVYGDGDLGTPGGDNSPCLDPCDLVVCDAPPAPACVDNVVQTYAATGTCDAGSCTYAVASTEDCTANGLACQGGACVDPGNLAPSPGPGEILITEVMQNPSAVGDLEGEWFEVHNPTAGDLELAGCLLESLDDVAVVIAQGGSLIVPAGGYAVLGRLDDPALNGGLDLDWAYGDLALSNGADTLMISCGPDEIDAIAWDGGTLWPDPTGASMQLNVNAYDPAANDLGGNWCEGTLSYGAGDLGTPGGANEPCADPCTDVVCDAPPMNTCEGDILQVYAATGTCDLGLCSYAIESTVDCTSTGEICNQGACVDPGAVNPAPLPGEIVITEITQNPSAVSDAAGEWFELYNTTDLTLDLSGCALASNNEAAHVIVGFEMGPMSYAVFAINGDTATNGGLVVDYVYESLGLGNGDDNLTLACDNGATIIDSVVWDNGDTYPDPNGASMQLSADALTASANDLGANWCEGTVPHGDGDLGTPGAANEVCADPCDNVVCDQQPLPGCVGDVATTYAATGTCDAGVCSYPPTSETNCADTGQFCLGGFCVTPPMGWPQPGEVIITEIMQNPSAVGDDVGEWFELYNTTAEDKDIAGCVINSGQNHSIPATPSLTIPAGGYVVLGLESDPLFNGGVTVDYVFFGTNLGNGEDSLTLTCGNEIDSVSWDDGATFPDPDGASMQLDIAAYDAASNDAGSAWCEATAPYGDGDLGTPGAANGSCGAPVPTWTNDVSPILADKCDTCHTTGMSGGVNHATVYSDTQTAADACPGLTIAECILVRVQNGSMPLGAGCTGDPVADAGNPACLSEAEQAVIEAWVSGGAPE